MATEKEILNRLSAVKDNEEDIMYLVDYVNYSEDTDDNRASVVCVHYEDTYMVDNTVNKENTRRIHLDELLENPNKYTLYELTPFTPEKQIATVQVKDKVQRVFEDVISTTLLRTVEPNTDVDVINIYCESDLDYLLDTLNENKDEFDKEEYEVDKETLESYKGRFDSREIWQVIFTDC